MPQISLTIKNEAKIARAWGKFPAEMAKAIASTLQSSGVFMTGKVKEYIAAGTGMWKAPLDTGALRRGIHPIFESTKAYIRPSDATPYATYVHEGTGRMKARPFFQITADREAGSLQKFALQQIEKALNTLNV